MERFAVIIPDRGDRPELMAFCHQQLTRMTLKPDMLLHINWNPVTDGFDLVERVHAGAQQAKENGINLCFIMENDDYYPANYFERFGDMKADFFGDDLTFYYNLKARTFNSFYHSGRSSLFTTGFRISALEGFQWGGDQFLDLRLWKWAKEKGVSTRFVNTGAIGIKHGIGLCGGKGHKMNLKNCDSNMTWLKSRVDREAYLFYSETSRRLWEKELV